jgi:hypothetical protein
MSETMLYRAPGPHNLHGVQVDYIIVLDQDVKVAQADGWHLTPTEAAEAHTAVSRAQIADEAQRADVQEAAESMASEWIEPSPEVQKRKPGRPPKVVE